MTTGVSTGFARRAAALLYDVFLLAALLLVYTAAALFFTHGRAVVHATVGAWVYAYYAGEITLIAGYYIVNWMRSGQTLGMRAWRIYAVSEGGKRLTAPAALRRLAWGILAWPPAGLGVLWLYLDPDHLAVHDRLSKTRVVQLTPTRPSPGARDRDERAEAHSHGGEPPDQYRIETE